MTLNQVCCRKKSGTRNNGLGWYSQFSALIIISLLIPMTYQISQETTGDTQEHEVGQDREKDQIEIPEQNLSSDYESPEIGPSLITKVKVEDKEEVVDGNTLGESSVEVLNDSETSEGISSSISESAESDSLLNTTNTNETIGGVNDTKSFRTIAYCTLPKVVLVDETLSSENLNTTTNSQAESGEVEVEQNEPEENMIIPKEGVIEEEILEDETSPSVKLVNMSQLLQDVLWSNSSIKSRVIPANCSIVLFYTSWCPFSAKAAPHFNALPRAFPQLRVAAIDATAHGSVNSHFGILSVPTILLFHNGKSIAKFNESSFTLNKFAEFIMTHTDLRSEDNINVTSQDFAGPLSSVPQPLMDFYLIIAWVFITVCFFYYVTKSALWRKAIDLVRTTWREAEDHVHQD